jgi:hypothetical protein
MTTLREFTTRHALLIFLILVFGISWGGMLGIAGSAEMIANGEISETVLMLAYLAMLAGPGIAGILLTGIVHGRAGLRDLALRLLKWQVGARWYASALLIAPIAILSVLLLLSRISADYIPRLFTTDDVGFLVQFSLISALVVGVFEELGWTGFATDLLLKRRHSILRTGLVVGILFAAWDSLVVFWVSGATSAAGEVPMVVFMPLVLFTWLPTFRVLMAWVYSHTSSLLVTILMHISLVAFWTALTPVALSGMALVVYYILVTAAFWIFILAIAAVARLRLPRNELVQRGA